MGKSYIIEGVDEYKWINKKKKERKKRKKKKKWKKEKCNKRRNTRMESQQNEGCRKGEKEEYMCLEVKLGKASTKQLIVW